jgi:membrane peptidoglycan carboxypeptidase
MKNVLTNRVAQVVLGGILAAGAMFAAKLNDITVTLPHSVTVGSSTLPAGTYTMSPMEMSEGTEYFVIRGAKTNPVVISTVKVEGDVAARSQVQISESNGAWRLDKLSVEGDTTSYEFAK